MSWAGYPGPKGWGAKLGPGRRPLPRKCKIVEFSSFTPKYSISGNAVWWRISMANFTFSFFRSSDLYKIPEERKKETGNTSK